MSQQFNTFNCRSRYRIVKVLTGFVQLFCMLSDEIMQSVQRKLRSAELASCIFNSFCEHHTHARLLCRDKCTTIITPCLRLVFLSIDVLSLHPSCIGTKSNKRKPQTLKTSGSTERCINHDGPQNCTSRAQRNARWTT